MSWTGLGFVEEAIVKSMGTLRAGGSSVVKTQAVLDEVWRTCGIHQAHTFDALCRITLVCETPCPLLVGFGNFGGRDEAPADPRFTEVALAPFGEYALGAGQFPAWLVNGTTYAGGTEPPFRPESFVPAALSKSESGALSYSELAELLGPPVFYSAPLVDLDLEALLRGRRTTLRIATRYEQCDGFVELLGFPPNLSPLGAAATLSGRLGAARVADKSVPDGWRVRVTIDSESDVRSLRAVLGAYPFVEELDCRLRSAWIPAVNEWQRHQEKSGLLNPDLKSDNGWALKGGE